MSVMEKFDLCDVCASRMCGRLAPPCIFCIKAGGKKTRFRYMESNDVGDFTGSVTFVICQGDEDARPYCRLFQPNEEGDCKFFDDHELQDSNNLYRLCVRPQSSDTCGVDKRDVR